MLGRVGPVGRGRAALVTRRGAKNTGWLLKHYERRARKVEVAEHWESAPALPPVVPDAGPNPRPRAFLDFAIGSNPVGRVTVELARDVLPRTVDNFLKLCEGKGKSDALPDTSFGYKDTVVHQIMKNSWITLGDIFAANGRGGHSAFGQRFFRDEGFFIRHGKPGILSMVTGGVHQNSSVFMISLKPLPHIDGRNVAFGAVVDGFDVVEKVSREFQVQGAPVTPIRVIDCGVLSS